MSESALSIDLTPDNAPAGRSRTALLKRLTDVVCLPASRINTFERAMTADLLVEMLPEAGPEARARLSDFVGDRRSDGRRGGDAAFDAELFFDETFDLRVKRGIVAEDFLGGVAALGHLSAFVAEPGAAFLNDFPARHHLMPHQACKQKACAEGFFIPHPFVRAAQSLHQKGFTFVVVQYGIQQREQTLVQTRLTQTDQTRHG